MKMLRYMSKLLTARGSIALSRCVSIKSENTCRLQAPVSKFNNDLYPTTFNSSLLINLNLRTSPLLSQTFNVSKQNEIIGDIASNKDIRDPRIINANIDVPIWEPWKDFTLPSIEKSEIEDPVTVKIIKHAARLIVIRRKKMKKHKWKKLQKKMKFVFAKRRQKRELKKEKAFQAILLNEIKVGEKFSAEKYVTDKLAKAHWAPPVTKVRGILCPDWVIKEHLQKQSDIEKEKARIEECLRVKK